MAYSLSAVRSRGSWVLGLADWSVVDRGRVLQGGRVTPRQGEKPVRGAAEGGEGRRLADKKSTEKVAPTAAASVGDPLPVRQRLRPAGDEVSKNEYGGCEHF